MPSEIRFAEFRKDLERHGWTLNRISGSHHVFVKQGAGFHINIPVHHGKVRPDYVRRIRKQIEDDDSQSR